MKYSIYLDNEDLLAGTTLKNAAIDEDNNMALHTTKHPQGVIANRTQLANSLQIPLSNFVCAEQTHSSNFHQVTKNDLGKGVTTMNNAIPNTDALYTYEPHTVLCSFTADCVPVLFYHQTSGVVGVIHSGWQGTVKEITLKTLQHLIQAENNKAEDFHVFLGPALSQDKFEVDEDVYRQFKQLGYADDCIYYKEDTNKYHIDNQRTVQKQCELAGVPTQHITMDRNCTFTSPEHFSYREDKQTGRHLHFIMKRKWISFSMQYGCIVSSSTIGKLLRLHLPCSSCIIN